MIKISIKKRLQFSILSNFQFCPISNFVQLFDFVNLQVSQLKVQMKGSTLIAGSEKGEE